MGTLPKGPPFLQDLKVTIVSSSRVYPLERQERRSMFLSNIDQVFNFNVETVHFFAARPDFPPAVVREKLRLAIERLLVPYDFLAGRLRLNPQEGKLEIDCTSDGAGFVVATSELKLDEIGELDHPNPAFHQLAVAEPPDALIVFQVTSFRCGSFALGVANNHATFDGTSFQIFLQNLASILAGKLLDVSPSSARRLLAARSPPQVTFPHPELTKLDSISITLLDAPTNNLESKLFYLSPEDISTLKDKAKMDTHGVRFRTTAITSFNVVTAHLWRCNALATEAFDPNKTSRILYAVDLRPRLDPTLPRSYTGNAVVSAVGTLTCQELREGPLARIVEILHEGATRIDDDYARSIIDWGELYKGLPQGDMIVSSWWRLGFAEVEYPWGKPSYTCPVVPPNRNITLLLPATGGAKKGVNVVVALPQEDMQRFNCLFYKLLA